MGDSVIADTKEIATKGQLAGHYFWYALDLEKSILTAAVQVT